MSGYDEIFIFQEFNSDSDWDVSPVEDDEPSRPKSR
jgi:hypothetical protein